MLASPWKERFGIVRELFSAMPIALQWLLLSIGKATLASVIMAFGANYATALFAVRNGFRVPVEGVPYLNFAIGLATFMGFMCTLALFACVVSGIGYLKIILIQTKLLSNFLRDWRLHTSEMSERVERALSRAKGLLGHIFLLFAALMLYALALYSLFDPRILKAIPDPALDKTGGGWSFLLIIWASLFVGVWCAGRGYGWVVAQIISAVMIFAGLFVGLFAPDVYGSFLRVIRSGGGISVVAQVREIENSAPAKRAGYMLLLSESYLILLSEGGFRITEIPLSQVVSIDYAVQPSWRLPQYDIYKQRELIYLGDTK